MSSFYDDTCFYTVIFDNKYDLKSNTQQKLDGIKKILGEDFNGSIEHEEGDEEPYLDLYVESNWIRIFLDHERVVIGVICSRAGTTTRIECTNKALEILTTILNIDYLPKAYAEIDLQLKGYHAPFPKDRKKNEAKVMSLAGLLLPQRSDLSNLKDFNVSLKLDKDGVEKDVTYTLNQNKLKKLVALSVVMDYKLFDKGDGKPYKGVVRDLFAKIDPTNELEYEYELIQELSE